MRVKTGGGKFHPGEPFDYFLAGHNIIEIAEVHPWNLIAADTVRPGIGSSRSSYNELSERTTKGAVLFDSGIFNLAWTYAKEHGIELWEALALQPSELDGFDKLWDVYVDVVREYEDTLWGYVELDQGGRDTKRRNRRRLEEVGINPIPVYHPLTDGWDYFDELCEGYDRICLANVVHASTAERRHHLATLWERRRQYPEVWVHVLGLTVSEIATVYPINSCDSSAWVFALRYGAQTSPGAHAMGDSFGRFTTTFSYDPALDRLDLGGQRRGVHFLASEARFMMESVRAQERDLLEVFGSDALLPAYDPAEKVRV